MFQLLLQQDRVSPRFAPMAVWAALVVGLCSCQTPSTSDVTGSLGEKTETPALAVTPAPEPPRKPPDPRRVPLPYGGHALMYTRENLVFMYRCSHGELGRMLRAKMAPLPVRIDGQILWFVDEVLNTQATVERTVTRWRRR